MNPAREVLAVDKASVNNANSMACEWFIWIYPLRHTNTSIGDKHGARLQEYRRRIGMLPWRWAGAKRSIVRVLYMCVFDSIPFARMPAAITGRLRRFFSTVRHTCFILLLIHFSYTSLISNYLVKYPTFQQWPLKWQKYLSKNQHQPFSKILFCLDNSNHI